MLNDWEAIFRVLEYPCLPLTNNEAERALGHWVILRRICYGTRTEQDSRVFARLISVLSTCRKRRQSPWVYLAAVIHSNRAGLAVPKLPVGKGSEQLRLQKSFYIGPDRRHPNNRIQPVFGQCPGIAKGSFAGDGRLPRDRDSLYRNRRSA
ncbi:MAG: IS66 family transposase [Methylococcales bacterium]